jgi:hypothetical protein
LKSKTRLILAPIALLILSACAQTVAPDSRPDPREIPVPEISTPMAPMPGPGDLPDRPEMPDVLTAADGSEVTTAGQWAARRQEMTRILEYYALGLAPPPPGNVKGEVIKSQLILNGQVRYRLVKLTFGPNQSLSLDIGIFAPVKGGPFPAVISIGMTPYGETPLPKLPQGLTQGQNKDVELIVNAATRPSTKPPRSNLSPDPESFAEGNTALARGYAYIMFNNNDCGEDTTLRDADGSWAFRKTRFFPAYPGYDWGLLRAWAWGVSRIVDYLQTDPEIDKNKLIITGVSRNGKAALVAGALDDRIAMVAPVASSGGGTPAFRFSGAERGGKEGLSEMMKKYPNYFSSHLHPFWGRVDKLPFDNHWYIALCAPRPFIALEGSRDQNVNENGVYQSWLHAQPAYALFNATDRLGVNWSDRRHGLVQNDWDAMFDFADKFLLGQNVDRSFAEFPPATTRPDTQRYSLDVQTLGAAADGKTKATDLFQKAIDQCFAAGGGDVVVPRGDYLIGSIELKSNVTLRLEADANITGSPDLSDYPIAKARWEGQWIDAYRGLIFAQNAHDIAIVGPGKIIGNPTLGGRQMPRRPVVIEPINCFNVDLEDFSTQQRRIWTIHPTECRNVTADNLTIRSNTGNGDGIDVDSCRHVLIENCNIDTGDDCIALKSGRGLQAYQDAKPTEDVQISDCTLGDSIFACIGIGSETSGGIHHVRIDHCIFTHAKTFSIYIKSRIGRGASIEDISAQDLIVQSATGGFLRINLLNSGLVGPDPVPGDEGIPSGGNYRFTHVKIANCAALVDAASISPAKPLDGLMIADVTGQCAKGMVLANIINANLSGIHVNLKAGPLLSIWNVTGTGLDNAVTTRPTTQPLVLR